jgi:hypothetical protein
MMNLPVILVKYRHPQGHKCFKNKTKPAYGAQESAESEGIAI